MLNVTEANMLSGNVCIAEMSYRQVGRQRRSMIRDFKNTLDDETNVKKNFILLHYKFSEQ